MRVATARSETARTATPQRRRRGLERPDDHGDRQEEDRIGEGLGEEVGVVDHRRGGDGRRRGEEGVAGAHERAREPVGGEDRGAHDERVQDLRELVADGDAAGEPGGCLRECGEGRREEERLAADEEPLPGRERLRELRVEELVREDRRRHMAQ